LDLRRPRELEVSAIPDARDEPPVAAGLPAELFVGQVGALQESVDFREERGRRCHTPQHKGRTPVRQ